MLMKRISVLMLLSLACYLSSGSCGKLLVWPPEHSHWLSIKTILDELVQRGHEVTVLTSAASILIDSSQLSAINFEIYPTSVSQEEFQNIYMEIVHTWAYDMPRDAFWSYFSKVEDMLWKIQAVSQKLCKDVVLNRQLMTKLQESKFDLVLSDPAVLGGELLAELLDVPFVYTFRFSPGSSVERHQGGMPLPPSYVPMVFSELSDRMSFLQRVKNMIYVLYFDFWFELINEKLWDPFYSEVLGRPTTLSKTMGKAEIWLIRTYWDFQFPHPFLPNIEFVGGLHCKPAKPLPKEIEEFVQSSGEDGIVVFTLGTMVRNMSHEMANRIALALAQIPQKVLWKFEGKKPDSLGKNTGLFKWLPQNDLLGHPKTRAFVTHGGTNGIYEAIYHGVPMVAIPLFADQYDNTVHMKAKGAAVGLDLDTMTSTDLLNALKTVINDPLYKENAMKLSRVHHEQLVKPLDRAVFWIEFVMRNKGAKHLRPALHDLTWAQYHSLDVIGFLLACVATILFVFTKCCLFCCRKFTYTGKRKKMD